MLTIFRINDPFRLLGVLLLLLAIRLPIIIGNFPLLIPELHWMVLGEYMAEGNQLYRDVWDFTGPLAGGVYWVIHQIVGRSPFIFHMLALFLVFYQASIFNWVLVQRDVFNEKTYIPALLYIIFMSLSFDFYTLSPPLMATTFLLLTAHKLFSLNDRYTSDSDIFKMGLYLGVASMLYLPSVLFFIMVFLGMAFFRVTSSRHLMLIIFGFALIVAGYAVYYLFTGSLIEFFSQYLLSIITYPQSIIHVPLLEMVWLCLIPAVILFFAISKTFSERGFVNFQTNCQQLMVIWLIPATLSVLFTPRLSTYQLVVFAPPLAFFMTHWLLLIKKRVFAELLFFIAGISILFICYNSLFNYIPQIKKMNYEGLLVAPSGLKASDQKILVLGDHLEHYAENQLGAPYLNWELSKRHFNDMDDYFNASAIHKNIIKDYPSIIIDTDGISQQLFNKLPVLAEKYRKSSTEKNVYYLIKKN